MTRKQIKLYLEKCAEKNIPTNIAIKHLVKRATNTPDKAAQAAVILGMLLGGGIGVHNSSKLFPAMEEGMLRNIISGGTGAVLGGIGGGVFSNIMNSNLSK